jgi:glycosyltransferase involved in cell wall biosynthesis
LKLIVQIPCFNEEETLAAVVHSIPRSILGIDAVEVLVIDDGSSDATADLARALGVEHIARNTRNQGLAASFATGLDVCLRLGADIVVNTDGDNQYCQEDIPLLIEPILRGEADIVVGDRQVRRIAHFSERKKRLQAIGSWTVRTLSGTAVPDAPSGFRAYSREAALRLNIVSSYSHTLETLIQAGAKRMAVTYVPVRTNPQMRESRLFRNVWQYVQRSGATMLRAYAMYQPLKVFVGIGALIGLAGLAGVLRFLYFYAGGSGSGHVQSLVLSAVLLIVGFQVGMIGLVADLIAANRRLMEEAVYRLKRAEIGTLDGLRMGTAERRVPGSPDETRASDRSTADQPGEPVSAGTTNEVRGA